MSLANPDEALPCATCGENDFLPSLCSHCQNYFCSKHLLDHPPCNKTTNRVLTDEERENMRQGISLESLFEKTMSGQRNQLQQQQQQKAVADKKTTATSSNSANIAPQSVGSSLLPGFHRYKRLEINTSNIPSVHPNSTCVVYFCFRNSGSSIPQEQQVAAAVARRERENDNDDEVKTQDINTSSFTITRPLWIDTSSTSSVGALLENLAKKLSSGSNSHLYFPSSNFNINNNANNTFWEKEKLQWRSTLSETFSAFETISQEKNFFELLDKFGDDVNSSHKIFSLHQSEPSKPMTSGCRVDEEKTEAFRSTVIGTGARVLFVILSLTSENIVAQDEDTNLLKSFISSAMNNNLWRKHSMCMLPFEKTKSREEEQQKETENKNVDPSEKTKKTEGNDDDASNNNNGPPLSSIPWAPGVSRTSPVVIGVNQNNTIGSGAATSLHNILLTVVFVFDSSGNIHPNTFGYTCKINTSWIAGKVIDEILNQNSNPSLSAASSSSGNKKNPVIALPPATFPSKTTKSLKLVKLSTGEVLDENSQIGKYFSNATTTAPDGIGILPCDAVVIFQGEKKQTIIPNYVVAEVKEYGVLVQSRKMPKPLMIRSMKDCVIQ